MLNSSVQCFLPKALVQRRTYCSSMCGERLFQSDEHSCSCWYHILRAFPYTAQSQPLFHHPVSPLSSQPPSLTELEPICPSLFPPCHVIGIMWCVASLHWLLSNVYAFIPALLPSFPPSPPPSCSLPPYFLLMFWGLNPGLWTCLLYSITYISSCSSLSLPGFRAHPLLSHGCSLARLLPYLWSSCWSL